MPTHPRPDLFAPPREITSLEECWFYHTIDLPGFGVIPGQWDLRGGVDDYLGRVPLAGKRVLELGTASGFLCFEMEKRGADVVAFDLAPGSFPDLIPFAAFAEFGKVLADQVQIYERLRNSYWLAHRALGSQARVVYGNLYELPAGIGPVDVATFGCILLHLRDPFLALANAARFVTETMIVTDVIHTDWTSEQITGSAPVVTPAAPASMKENLKRLFRAPEPIAPPAAAMPPAAMTFLFDPADPSTHTQMNSWWQFTPALVTRMLSVLGFADASVTTHTQRYENGHQARMYTVVAKRTAPLPKRIDGPYPWY